MVISRALSDSYRYGAKVSKKILVLDISRAHFHPPARREIYIRLPPEDSSPGLVGLLRRCMYGTRDAAQGWEDFYVDGLAKAGYKVGDATPCAFAHGLEDSAGVVHGDDFIFEGPADVLLRLERHLGETMLVKRKALLGPDATDDKQVVILGRLLSYGSVDGQRST